METISEKLKRATGRLFSTVLWATAAAIVGVILGFLGALFYLAIAWATGAREAHPLLMLLLVPGAALVLLFYHLLGSDNPKGTNLVLSGIREGDDIPLRMTPLIFVSTVFSHLVGASVGREGAALQLGGSVGSFLAHVCRLNEQDRRIMILAGMSAAFSALLGTPLAAAVFAMEITTVGIMNYAALLPCVVSALTAKGIALLLGIRGMQFTLSSVPSFGVVPALQTGLLGALCGLISILFISSIHKATAVSEKLIKNKYLRALAGGTVLLLLTFLFGFKKETYNGAGMALITGALKGHASWYDFLLKILFTALSIAIGYKGGEIVPSFVIGATGGCFIGSLIGLDPTIAAAAGMGAVFCGATNCPVTSILFCFELFGFEGMPYYMLSIAVSYVFSSYYSLYATQKFHFPKFRGDAVD